MTRALRYGAALCLLAALGACAAAAGPQARTPSDRNHLVVTEAHAEMHANAYLLLRALRPHWLQTRVSGSISPGGSATPQKRVYLDDAPFGGLDQLQQISTRSIRSIRHFDGPAATQRWGTDHVAGAILIQTLDR